MDRNANSKANLHFHGFFFLEGSQDKKWLLDKLKSVFGDASSMAGHQFRIGRSDIEKSHSFADREGIGCVGKLNYMLSHVGTTMNVLELNEDGKRSRKAPRGRRIANRRSKGLAEGLPKNFLREALVFDSLSKREAQKAFEDWIKSPSDIESPKASSPQIRTPHNMVAA